MMYDIFEAMIEQIPIEASRMLGKQDFRKGDKSRARARPDSSTKISQLKLQSNCAYFTGRKLRKKEVKTIP